MELLNIKDIVNQFKENYTYMNEDGVVKKEDYFDLDKGYYNLNGYKSEDSELYHKLETILDYIIKENNLVDIELEGVYNSENGEYLLEYVVKEVFKTEGKETSIKLLDYQLRVNIEGLS